jgi:hypothetical protein
MKNAVDIFNDPGNHPRLSVLQHVVIRAIKALDGIDRYIEGLALIRGSYASEDGAFASLAEAKEIYELITGNTPWEPKA